MGEQARSAPRVSRLVEVQRDAVETHIDEVGRAGPIDVDEMDTLGVE
jgi:hypothetical protein